MAKLQGRLEHLEQKLAITVVNSGHALNSFFAVLAKLFDTRLKIATMMKVINSYVYETMASS